MKSRIIILLLAILCFLSITQSYAQTGGLGAILRIDTYESYPYISAIVPSSPAAEIQLRVFDHILSIDGKDLKGRKLPEIVEIIRGPIGTKAAISYKRDGLEFIDTFTRGPAETNPLFFNTPTGEYNFAYNNGDAEKDHFKDSFLKIFYTVADSFKPITGAWHEGKTKDGSYYASHSRFPGSFDNTIFRNRHYFTSKIASSEDSVKLYLQYMKLIHLVTESLQNSDVTDYSTVYKKTVGLTGSSLTYGFVINKAKNPGLETRKIAILLVPTGDAGLPEYEIRVLIFT